jgi:predicted molibdopterin-dependent oxidoreductase YjgC
LVSRVSRELLEPLVKQALRVHGEKLVVSDPREPLELRE